MTGARVELDERAFKRASELLETIPRGYQTALTRAFNRALQEGRTEATRAVTKEYTLKAKQVRPTFKMQKASRSRLEASLDSAGQDLPLEEYKHRPHSDTTGNERKRVKVGVKKGGLKDIDRGFIWQGRVMRREGRARLPIERRFGPAVPITLNNDEVVENVVDKISESVNKRLEHETDRLLNGG